MKVLVTGGAGYLGSVLVEGLLHHPSKFEVTVVDSFEHGQLSLAHLVASPRLEIKKVSLLEYGTNRVAQDIGRSDVVIHLAALVGPACDTTPAYAERINFEVTNFVQMAMQRSARLIYPCTNSGYGIGGKEVCTEADPLRPLSQYGKTKVMGEEVAMQRENSISLRLATLFGWSPRMRRDLLVNDLTWRAVRDQTAVIFEGGFRRNFCHVRDAARAMIHALDSWDTMKGQIYNVGDTRANTTKIGLCQAIAEIVPGFKYLTSDVGEDPDKRDYIVANYKIEKTGWRPQFSLHDGIRELVRGYAMMKREPYGNV